MMHRKYIKLIKNIYLLETNNKYTKIHYKLAIRTIFNQLFIYMLNIIYGYLIDTTSSLNRNLKNIKNARL